MPPIRPWLLILVLAVTAGCQTPTATPDDTLYQDLGARAGIADVVEELLYLIVDDDRINRQFRGLDVASFHRHLTDQLCQLAGGPCTYSGRAMRPLHAEMAITDTEFNALTENLVLAMERNDIATGVQNRLLARLIALYPEVRNL